MAIGFREASDRAVDAGAWRQCRRGGPGTWRERQPGFQVRRGFERGELIEPCTAPLHTDQVISICIDRPAQSQITGKETVV